MGETEKAETAAESTAETAAAGTAGEQREKAAGPADEARRALRAARERSQEQDPSQGPSQGPSREPSVRPAGPALRPGDAARAALRRTAESAPTADAVTMADPTPAQAAQTDDADPTTAPTPPATTPPATPASANRASANPAPTHPASATPAPSHPALTDLASATPAPSHPALTDLASATPAPSHPALTDLASATPAPSHPALTHPASATPAPTHPALTDPASANPAPTGLSPTAPSSAGVPPAGAEPRAPQAGTGSRPGDIAREALRAARAEARQGRQGLAETRTRAGRGTPRGDGGLRPRTDARPTDARRHVSAHDRVADERARVVRELLAGAFQMPSEETAEPEPEAEPEHQPEYEPEYEAEGRAEGETGPGSATADDGSSPERSPFAPLLGSAPPLPLEPSRTPRSMAAPARDGDHRRTFPAFPPRAGGSFAGTWWGNAWVTALEEGALDPNRLARGRGYAEQGHVDAITVTPGLVLAYVQGSRPRPYRVQVRLRTLGGEDWERFLEAAVERPGHIAALLDKEMPESLAECGVPLLPGPGDLEPQCSCPDRGHPCKHAAALCYQTARLLDADPFVLFLLRGRGEREVLDALSRRNAARAARAAQEQEPEPLPGVRAAEALAERRLPPLPAPLPVPPHPEQPPAYPSAPNGPDSFALDHLATDAAARAHALLVTGQDEIGELTLWRDAVRLAASRPGSGLTVTTRALYAALASAAGRTPVELARAVAAWRQGGPDGLTVLEETWDPPAGRFDRARPLLLAADLPAFRPRRNHLTHPRGHVQLRFGRDGLWYAYESEPGHDDWWPRGTPGPDPVGALTGLGGSDEL
ncbi:SWIM zinc finger family protein [Streptomyces sp. NPDC060002]|uniref:SWIM zinc finger family protein n=1 Tax=Streptomyces sp. NPDC060002 TaxID=3347033 RepID=UPI0036AE5982